MDKLNIRIGKNIGTILLEIAQTAIKDGNPQKAIDTYTKALNGFTEEYAVKVLKNDYVLVTDGEVVSLTDSESGRISNKGDISLLIF